MMRSTAMRVSRATGGVRYTSGFAQWDFSWIKNEMPKPYAPGSADRANLQTEIDALLAAEPQEIPCVIGGKEVFTGNVKQDRMPTKHAHVIANYHVAGKPELRAAIDASMSPAAREWASWPFEDRAAVFLKAADLIAGKYREKLNASIMLTTGKTPREADIDNSEISDFFRFGVRNAHAVYKEQPPSLYGAQNYWNRVEHRPLEGFVLAIAPFNFCALGANLAGIPVLMGNTCVFKPSSTAVHESYMAFKVLEEAGLPDGVINFVPCAGRDIGDLALGHKDLGGVNFTGSTGTFHQIWRGVAENIDEYKSYPRLCGETGGKNFHFVHESADVESTVHHTVRGAFDYQGQKCSATSRAYVPRNLWEGGMREKVIAGVKSLKQGCSSDMSNFLTAVIDETSFDKIEAYVADAKAAPDAEVIVGGGCDKSVGYFIEPTVIETTDAEYATMCDELFGPVLTVHVYDPEDYEATLAICDATSEYALTGAIFAADRRAVKVAHEALKNAAGNFYVNDKCTGAAVGEQPFGGSRKSGTNDKTGTILNNLRWVSPRTIKETFDPLGSPFWPCNSDKP